MSSPWPSAQTAFRGRSVRIYEAETVEDDTDTAPGTVSKVTKHGFTVRCGQGALSILSLQPEGKKEMSADAFLRGYRVQEGECFGTPSVDQES